MLYTATVDEYWQALRKTFGEAVVPTGA